jgi:hypothetical protein
VKREEKRKGNNKFTHINHNQPEVSNMHTSSISSNRRSDWRKRDLSHVNHLVGERWSYQVRIVPRESIHSHSHSHSNILPMPGGPPQVPVVK